MCRIPWSQPTWNEVASARHRDKRQAAISEWGRSLYAANTFKRKSKYDPNLTRHDIQRIEMECVRDARLRNGELPPTICGVRRYYRWFRDFIGASDGTKTNYIVVIHEATGDVHGFPVTEKYLKENGAQL